MLLSVHACVYTCLCLYMLAWSVFLDFSDPGSDPQALSTVGPMSHLCCSQASWFLGTFIRVYLPQYLKCLFMWPLLHAAFILVCLQHYLLSTLLTSFPCLQWVSVNGCEFMSDYFCGFSRCSSLCWIMTCNSCINLVHNVTWRLTLNNFGGQTPTKMKKRLTKKQLQHTSMQRLQGADITQSYRELLKTWGVFGLNNLIMVT